MDDSQAPDSEVEAAREEVIEAMERTAEIYGLSRSYGRLYGLLFFADEPMSLDTLVEESGYAKSTVSTAMSELKRLYLVRRRSIPGEGKKAFYEAERDLWTVFQEFLDREVRREIETMLRSLEQAEQTLEAAEDDQAEQDLQKVRKLRGLYDRSQRLVGLLTSSSVDRLAGLLDRFQRD